jgi:hypothetical protein
MSRRFEYAFSYAPREVPPSGLQTLRQPAISFPVLHGRNTACEQDKKDWMNTAYQAAARSRIGL